MRGFVVGSLMLIVLEVLVTSDTSKTTGLLAWGNSAFNKALSPTVAAIPNVAGKGSSSPAAQGTAYTTPPTVPVPTPSTGLAPVASNVTTSV